MVHIIELHYRVALAIPSTKFKFVDIHSIYKNMNPIIYTRKCHIKLNSKIRIIRLKYLSSLTFDTSIKFAARAALKNKFPD